MNYLSLSPVVTNTNIENNDYYNNKTPNYNSRTYCKNHFHLCLCHCHCQCHNGLKHNFSSCQMNFFNNPLKLYLEQKYNYHPLRNKSTNYLFTSYNNYNNNSIDKFKNKYFTYYDYNNINDKTDYSNSYIQKFEKQRNYSYQDIKIKNNYKNINEKDKNESVYNNLHISDNNNINMEKKNKNNNYFLNKHRIKPINSFQIKRKGLSKYYHIISPKKYSYGGKILQTENNTNNHSYKEIVTSKSKGKDLKKSLVINYNENNNDNNYINDSYKYFIKSNDINKKKINNKESNFKFINYRYKTYQNSPIILSRNEKYEPKKLKAELSHKIVKETPNTRLVESKELKKSPTENNLYESNYDIKYKNNINNYRTTPNKKQNNLNHYLYNNENGFNQVNNKDNSYNKNQENNYYQIKNHLNSHNIQKSYSLNNLNIINNNILKKNIQNEYNNDFSYNYNKNNKDNNANYEQIKLKVKLALLRKQMYEHEKGRILNNNNNKNIFNKDYLNYKQYLERFLSKNKKSRNLGDNLLEKTKKLLEGKKLRNKKRELNNIDLKSQENKILLRLQKNLREKNNDYNMNIIKPKIKYWKP